MKSTNLEELCASRGYDLQQIEAAALQMPEPLQKYTRAAVLRPIVVEAINEGRVPDYNNSNELKWEPIFDLRDGPSGVGLVFSGADCWGTDTHVGARLVLFSDEDATFFGENFTDLHIDALTYKK
jgi:hypothetical protein